MGTHREHNTHLSFSSLVMGRFDFVTYTNIIALYIEKDKRISGERGRKRACGGWRSNSMHRINDEEIIFLNLFLLILYC